MLLALPRAPRRFKKCKPRFTAAKSCRPETRVSRGVDRNPRPSSAARLNLNSHGNGEAENRAMRRARRHPQASAMCFDD